MHQQDIRNELRNGLQEDMNGLKKLLDENIAFDLNSKSQKEREQYFKSNKI